MSRLARWSYTQTLTVWPISAHNEFGAPSFGTPYVLNGTWALGGDIQRDANGTEFVPASRYWFEAADGSATIPKRESYIKRGNHIAQASPPNDAERIRKIDGWDVAMLHDDTPDWVLYT